MRCGYFTGDTTPPGCKKMIADYEQRIAELEQENERLKGVIEADDKRLSDAAISVWGEHIRGCDTPQEMAELINYLRPLAKSAELELHESFISGMERAAKIIAELEQENDRLRGLTVKLARECFDDGYRAGIKRAAGMFDEYPTGWQVEEAIRAELEPVER
jgi:hypothetical protein